MATSPEYPQYTWVVPKSYTKGRQSGCPTVIVIHTTEGSEGPSSAEDGAAYDARRTDGTSTHFFCDSTSTVQCVRTTDTAHAAMYSGNRIGIHIEICGKAGQSSSQWDDDVSQATLRQVASLCRVLLADYPWPVVHLSPSKVRGGAEGFCGHDDISEAFHESDHWDPGPNFPWGQLFDLIEEDIVTPEDMEQIADTVIAKLMSVDMSYHDQTVTYKNLLRNLHQQQTETFPDWVSTQMWDAAADPCKALGALLLNPVMLRAFAELLEMAGDGARRGGQHARVGDGEHG